MRWPRNLPKSRPKTASEAAELGALPEWNLDRSLSGHRRPALKRDLEQADADCIAFEQDFKGKLAADGRAGRARQARRGASSATRRSRTCIGRLVSYAGLLYAGNTDRSGARQILRRRAGAA